MAKRGRKVGGFKINNLTDREEIVNKLINQINSLNKKIKKFGKEGITEYERYLQAYLTDDLVKWNPNGSISKSKKFYEDKHIIWLKKALSATHKLNNNRFYGTVTKYKKEVALSNERVSRYVRKRLEDKGYNADFINRILNNDTFYKQLYMRFSEGASTYGSDQMIDEVTLNYADLDGESGFTYEELDKFISDVEYAQNTQDRINAQQEAVNRLLNKR